MTVSRIPWSSRAITESRSKTFGSASYGSAPASRTWSDNSVPAPASSLPKTGSRRRPPRIIRRFGISPWHARQRRHGLPRQQSCSRRANHRQRRCNDRSDSMVSNALGAKKQTGNPPRPRPPDLHRHQPDPTLEMSSGSWTFAIWFKHASNTSGEMILHLGGGDGSGGS